MNYLQISFLLALTGVVTSSLHSGYSSLHFLHPKADSKEAALADYQSCNDQRLLYCNYHFNQALNISDSVGDADWHNPKLFKQIVENVYLHNGYRGLIQVCSAISTFHTCLKETEPACINVLFFLNHQYKYHDSYQYVALLRQMHFMCSGGFMPALRDSGLGWPCITNMIEAKNETLQKCWNTFAAAVHSNTNNACPAGEQLLSCYRRDFQYGCGTTASWWACEAQRIAVNVWFPNCQLQCQVGMDLKQGKRQSHEASIFGLSLAEIKKMTNYL